MSALSNQDAESYLGCTPRIPQQGGPALITPNPADSNACCWLGRISQIKAISYLHKEFILLYSLIDRLMSYANEVVRGNLLQDL